MSLKPRKSYSVNQMDCIPVTRIGVFVTGFNSNKKYKNIKRSRNGKKAHV
nr:MAG TPA: hypothetical protein [Caudoviricetes sp.]